MMGIVVLVASLVGCGRDGKKMAHLKGAVTVGGQPLPADSDASISFRVEAKGQGRSTSARIIDGKYDSPNTPLGNVRAYFNIQQPTGKMAREGIGNPYPEYRSLVPSKYQQGKEIEVQGDNENQDFDL